MFELPKVRYIEGAPAEWRRVLTPGLTVRLRFVEDGLAVLAAKDSFGMTWDAISYLAARGPDVPEHQQLCDRPHWNKTVAYLAWLAEPKESYCWLAVGLAEAGSEMIFEVEEMLRPQLQDTLESHSG